MKPFRTIWLRIRSVWRRREVKREIDEELRFTSSNARRRTSPPAWRRRTPRARRASGSGTCRAFARNVVRRAARVLGRRRGGTFALACECWKNPGFTAIAVLMLAVGIGATTAVFDLVQGVLLTPPPYARPDRIVLLTPERLDRRPYAGSLDGEQWLGWRTEAKSYDAMAGYGWEFCFVVRPEGSQPVEGQKVTRDYFRVMGIKPLLGREFVDSDGDAETGESMPTVILMGYNLWQRMFNGDPAIIGKTIQLRRNGATPPITTMTIVGVMPPGIRFLPSPHNSGDPNYDVNAEPDFWFPLPATPKWSFWNVVARLHEAVTVPQAQAELTAIAARQARANHELEGITARAQLLSVEMNRQGRWLLLPLFGAVTLVFLIACANVAGLMLARGFRRQPEYAVRCALGAGRRTLRHAPESLLLAFFGAALGAALAMAAVKLLKVTGGFAIPRLETVTLDWPMMVFCWGLAALAAVLAGFVPALRASRFDPAQAVKGVALTVSAGRAERRLLAGMTILQVALTFALLVGAGLLVRTTNALAKVQAGYDTKNILTLSVTSMRTNWEDFNPLERIAALPGVRNAAFAWGVPLTGNAWNAPVEIEGRPDLGTLKNGVAIRVRSVTADYFDALGFNLVAGRSFRPADNSDNWKGMEAVPGDAPMVAIVNQTLADRYFPNANPIGRKLRSGIWPWRAAEIVGVVANARTEDLTQEPGPEVYYCSHQLYVFTKHLIIRTTSDPQPLIGVVQRELRAIDPTLAIGRVKTLEQLRGHSVAAQTFAMRLLVGFSLVGSVLALVGIYGVLSLSVGSRKREIAIRMAVGAQRRDVLGLVLSEGLRLIGIGLLLGAGIALISARVLRSFLYGVEPTDLVTFGGVAASFHHRRVAGLLAARAPRREG